MAGVDTQGSVVALAGQRAGCGHSLRWLIAAYAQTHAGTGLGGDTVVSRDGPSEGPADRELQVPPLCKFVIKASVGRHRPYPLPSLSLSNSKFLSDSVACLPGREAQEASLRLHVLHFQISSVE